MDRNIERVELRCLARQLDRIVEPTEATEQVCRRIHDESASGRELERPLERRLRALPVPIERTQYPSQGCVRFRELGLYCDRPLRSRLRAREAVGKRYPMLPC